MKRVPTLRWRMIPAAGALWALALGPAALAQPPGQPGPGGQPGLPGRGFGGPGGLNLPGPLAGLVGGMMGGMGGMMGGGGRLVATDKRVYVLRGNQLLAYEAGSLKPTGATMLPEPGPGPGGPQP